MIKNRKLLKIISLFGVVGVVFYFMHVIFGGIFYEGYNPISQAISDLTAINSPSKSIASIFSFLYGVFNVTFCIVLYFYLKGKISKLITIGSCFFLVMSFISFIGYTLFPLSEAGYAGTFQDKMHMLVTVFVVIFTIIAIILFCIGFLKTSNYKCLGIVSLITFVLLLLGAMLINILPKEYFGIAERINVYSIVVYIGILSIWLYKNINKKTMGALHSKR